MSADQKAELKNALTTAVQELNEWINRRVDARLEERFLTMAGSLRDLEARVRREIQPGERPCP